MNGKVEKLLNVILDDALNVREFVIDKAPVVVQQLLAWNFWESLLFSLVPILLLIAVYATSKMTKFWDYRKIDDSISGKIITIIVMILIGMDASCVISENLDWLQILIAPDLYLLECAKGIK